MESQASTWWITAGLQRNRADGGGTAVTSAGARSARIRGRRTRRSDRNARAAVNDVILRGRVVGCPLIATDGFEYYVGAVVGLFGSACVYGQVLKTRRNDRVIRVERRLKIGTASRLKAALLASEDSETLNTSFVERLNLTIRQGSAYLRRRSPCHARGEEPLRGHAELLRCYYNFIRPHSALKFGRETRTPAMQAGLVSTRLN